MARSKGYRKASVPKKPPLTHFLCLPLVTTASKPQLEASLRTFRDDMSTRLSNQGRGTGAEDDSETLQTDHLVSSTIHPKAIRPVGALHCTLGVMSLDKDRLHEAIELFEGLDMQTLLEKLSRRNATVDSSALSTSDAADQILLQRPIPPPLVQNPSEPLIIDLKGLVSMHPPQNTSILYASPLDSTDRLYPFSLAIQKVFKDKDLLVPDDRDLILHATVVNTIYGKGKRAQASNQPRRQPMPNVDPTDGPTDGPTESESLSQASPNEDNGAVEGHGPNANAPLKIDARGMIEKYQDFVWASHVVLDRIAICEMGARKRFDADGKVVGEEYVEVASVALVT